MSEVNIQGRDIISLLLSEARRKPNIAVLVDNINNMTVEEIDAIKVPLPWYRNALKKLKTQSSQADTNARALELVNKFAVNGVVQDTDGAMRQYSGDTCFVTVDRGGMLEIKTGSLIWFPKSGGVWLDTLFSEIIDGKLSNSTFIGETSKSGYSTACANRRNQNAPTNVPHTVVAGATPPQNPLFRIERI